MFSLITTLLLTAITNVDPAKGSIYWRFEPGPSGGTIASVQDESGRFEAVAGKQAPAWTEEMPLSLNNGYVQFSMQSGRHGMVTDDAGDHAAVYLVPETQGSTMTASCVLKITGQSQWAAPVVRSNGHHGN